MSTQVTIYQKPTCSTCRRAIQVLQGVGGDVQFVDYYEVPFKREQLAALIKKMGITPRALLRTKEARYQAMGAAGETLGDDAVIDLMIRDPDLMQRPIVECGGKAVLARPIERMQEILKKG